VRRVRTGGRGGLSREGRTIIAADPTVRHELAAGFGEWAALWSRLGFWLTLWDEHGNPAARSGPVPFWDTLYLHSARLRERLHHAARGARQNEGRTTELEPRTGTRLATIPLTYRHRPRGAVLGCALTREFLDQETFARFCDLHLMDREALGRLVSGVPIVEASQVEAGAHILTTQMQSLLAGGAARKEMEDLTAHLGQAYEELNLIYRISAGMTGLVRPIQHLERICREVAAATPLAGMVAVLEPTDGSGQESVVRGGSLAVPDSEVLRLYRQVRRSGDGQGVVRVVNHASEHPEFAWARDWLRHFAFYDLSRKGRAVGAIVAINRTDAEDLGSYEIQLVTTVAERSAAFLETLSLYDDLEHLFLGMLHALVASIDAKDPYTCGHSQRVAWLSRHLSARAGFEEESCRRVYLSGLLHDIGKIGISEAVLRKTGRLTNSEFEEMKRHPEIGARILEGVPHVSDLIPGVLYHHERLDGRGYPAGLKGAEVPFLGRVIGLADAFDAITTNRTYRRAQLVEVAAAEIRRCAGTQFDPELSELLLAEDLHALHQHLTELSRQPVRAQPLGALRHPLGVDA